MIGLVTDSSSQLPPELAERYGVAIVPIPITVDGVEYREGVDLDVDDFYAMFDRAGELQVSTSQPSPGEIADRYGEQIERGATSILSVHVGEELSGTLNSARLAAADCPVPVRLVDSRTTSFGVGCCVLEAARALASGASLVEAAEVAENLAAEVRSVFILQALGFVRRGGRLSHAGLTLAEEIPVLTTAGAAIAQIGQARDVDELCDVMADAMVCDGRPIRAAVGIADRHAEPFWIGLEDRLARRDDVVDLVRYRVGPSVGAHTGPGTAGGFWYPVG